MSSDVVKEGAELLKLAMASDKKGKKGDKAKQLDAAIMYLQAQRLFTRAAGRECPSPAAAARSAGDEALPRTLRRFRDTFFLEYFAMLTFCDTTTYYHSYYGTRST